MSYDSFKRKVNALIERSGDKQCNPHFKQDTDRGNFICYLNDDNNTRIIGSESSLKVTVRWGFDADKPANYSHQTMVAI